MALHLVRKLRLTHVSSAKNLASQFFRKTVVNPEFHTSSFVKNPTFRNVSTFHSSTPFRSFGSAAGNSEDGIHQEFQKWSNGGGLFHNSACIDPTTVVETGAVVHPKATLGANVHVGSGAVVGPSVTVGDSTRLGYNVALSNCSIGDSCIIHNGVCIGQDGFGVFVDEHGNMEKKPQTLYARIGNHVELGANSCVDRGSWRDTVIGDHTKIDNLVQVGHNVIIGKSCILCGQVGIAGSATIGDYVTLGGRVAVRDHVSVVSKVRLAANSCVTKDIKEPGDYGGFPAVPLQQWRRQVATQRWVHKKDVPLQQWRRRVAAQRWVHKNVPLQQRHRQVAAQRCVRKKDVRVRKNDDKKDVRVRKNDDTFPFAATVVFYFVDEC